MPTYESLKLEEINLPDIFHLDEMMIPPASSKNVKTLLIMLSSATECSRCAIRFKHNF